MIEIEKEKTESPFYVAGGDWIEEAKKRKESIYYSDEYELHVTEGSTVFFSLICC